MKYAIVTPSYAPDFERCRLLSETVERHVTGNYHHYLIVDHRDRQQFQSLEGPRTTVVTVESVVPWWLRRPPLARRWWLSLKTPPVRNWILQQVVKLSVAEFIEADAYIFVDSDVAFIRPLCVETLSQDGGLLLFRVEGAARLPTHGPWHQTAAKLLGLPPSDYFGATYIGNLITWRRETLKLLYRHMESVTGLPWIEAVCRQWHLSEYILYGIFVEHVLKTESGHHYSDIPLCHISWDYTLKSDADLAGFFSEVWPEHVAVMVSSKQQIDVTRYRELLERVKPCPECIKCDSRHLEIKA